jgi:4-hydroxybenzoate polyprenyltransferase
VVRWYNRKLPALRKTFRIALGVTLVILGLIGGLIPFVQGWILGIPGLLILSEYFPPVKRLVDWAKAKMQRRPRGPSQGDTGDPDSSRR